MDLQDHVSLIDLSKQLPFEIDQNVKEEICFGETLIISCGHYDGDLEYEESSSESEWSCEESTEATVEEEEKDDNAFEIKDYVAEETVQEEEEEEDDDFSFYFFPDCHKPPPPQNSKTSLIVVNGLPKLNPTAKKQKYCTCKKDKTGECPCYTKVPCKCGAKTVADCTCSELKAICVCTGEPRTECKCKNVNVNVCVCDPDGRIFPKCTCAEIEKPCICHPGKFPSPVCKCKYKPKFNVIKTKTEEVTEEDAVAALHEAGTEEEGSINLSEEQPCVCQTPDPKKKCYCLKGKDCTCLTECICGVQRPCLCEPEESPNPLLSGLTPESARVKCDNIPCKQNDENISTCSCDDPKLCTCDHEKTGAACKCFPEQVCTCGDPEKCKCFSVCDCINPCICDTLPIKPKECTCLKPSRAPDYASICQCIQSPTKSQKKVRAGKTGYRWCHVVPPKHTYFDYAYGKHDKINDEIPKEEKFEIQGMHDKKPELGACPVHGATPKFEKKPRKPSLDCCSAVGGISICVESLGEDKDKLLVQVVSYSSKEGAKTGSKLVSILDCNLHTMEENRVEHITKKNLTKERRSYLAICDSGYYNKVTRICGERHVVKRFYHTFEMAHNFVLEGSNIVFLRYLALRRYKGTVQTDTVMMNGTICRSIYISKGVSQGIVNGTPFFVVKVERHIVEPSGYVHKTLTVLSLKGYTISHEWADNCYIFHVNPLLRVVPERDEIEQHEPLRDTWRNDLQLMSDFLDFKSTRVSEGGRYVTESGTLTGTVRDYLQAILLLRPQDTLHFTRHYFGTVLSALDLPHDEYFDPTSKHVRYYFFEE
ncbi:hypothetical protein PYW08_002129 [Mythimna loreyi]|uniref:Uncharacterized protein n=1 Tax=Mythimna loreyi TaxID=667449 RepID=A0ACC2R631_9NEOP|nr:hypothetical protein PYW08_002129 [Mythimna loreyi]